MTKAMLNVTRSLSRSVSKQTIHTEMRSMSALRLLDAVILKQQRAIEIMCTTQICMLNTMTFLSLLETQFACFSSTFHNTYCSTLTLNF